MKENLILSKILQGYKTSEIAKQLNLKPNTISTVKKNIFNKLQITNIVEIYKYFYQT